MTENEKKAVLEYIDSHKDDIVDFLCDFISQKSINLGTPGTGEEGDAQKWVADRFGGMGFSRVDRWLPDENQDRPNVVGVIEGRGNGKALILQGHCDVVPVLDDERELWTYDPWKGTVKDGKLYGRGASDTKGGNTAMFWAAKSIIDCGIGLSGDLVVESVIGEESQEGETIGAAATVQRGYRAPFAIVSEPTNCEVHIESTGVFMFELTVPGKSTHFAARNQVLYPQRHGIDHGPSVGADAIAKATLFIDLFSRLEVQWNQRWQSPTLGGGGRPLAVDKEGVGLFNINISFINGGGYIASVPGACTLSGLVSYPSWVQAEDVICEMKKKILAVSGTDDWLLENPPVFRAPVVLWKPYRLPGEHEGVRVVSKAYQEVTNKTAIISGFRGSCDATFLNDLGVPAVTFGPGSLGFGVHGPNEYVPVEEVIRCAKVYAVTALTWCGSH
ncbi:MAG: ArgE/DapE family deacylase [Spirochaetes bacterium]|nr:ArgE/DapE family deacylase [Spirochaetota bacterium]